jgi:Tfp pilus assembly major pilin PilA
MFCNKCGAENADNSHFCSSCGAPISTHDQQVSCNGASNPISGSKKGDIQEYYESVVGYKNTDYYLSKFIRFDSEGPGISWNWPAFFISFYWLLYRKMWVWALLYFLLPIPLGIIEAILSPVSEATVGIVYSAFLAAIFIAFPMYANAIYYKHIKAKIQKAKNYSPDIEKQLRMLAAEGGTSGVALIIILIIVFIAIIGILAAIAIPAYQDYTLRAKVAEGLTIGQDYKQKVEAYTIQHSQWPSSNTDIGLAEQIDSANIASISVNESGVVVITYGNGPQLNGKSVALIPSVNDENYIVWECKGIDMENRYLPMACRK